MKRKPSKSRKHPGRGRPKGSTGKQRKSKVPISQLCEALFNDDTPLDFLLSAMKDKRLALVVRISAAGHALPYMHRKKPVAVEFDDRREMTKEEVRAETGRILSEIRARNGATATAEAVDDNDS